MTSNHQFSQQSEQQQFAQKSAFQRLQYLAYEFDFHRDRRHASYVDIRPDKILRVIDGFLGEPDNWQHGDFQELKDLRITYTMLILPAYDMGKLGAIEWWDTAYQVDKQQSVDLLYEIIELSAPQEFNFAQKNWYIEAYCKTHHLHWMQWMIDSQLKH